MGACRIRGFLKKAGMAVGGLVLVALLRSGTAQAADVYITNSGNAAADNALVTMLQGFGHTVTLGVSYLAFDGTQSLAGHGVVYLQSNYNWSSGTLDMPIAGQTALVNFINSGGGLVTNEWTIWKTVSHNAFATLSTAFPVVPTAAFNGGGTTTYTQATPESMINAGLPAAFAVPLTTISGTETFFTSLRPGASTYYNSSNSGAAGLVGGTFGAGRVLQFSTVNGQGQVADPNFSRLLSNTLGFAATGSGTALAPEPDTLGLGSLGVLGLFLFLRQKR